MKHVEHEPANGLAPRESSEVTDATEQTHSGIYPRIRFALRCPIEVVTEARAEGSQPICKVILAIPRVLNSLYQLCQQCIELVIGSCAI